MFTGPQWQRREDRRARILQLVEQLQAAYGPQLVVIGLYGSAANETDGPFSDSELFCVVDQNGLDKKFVWVDEQGKVELDLCDKKAVVRKATRVDADWPRRGKFRIAKRLYGDKAYFDYLMTLPYSLPNAVFDNVMIDIILGHYEAIGKLRNARAREEHSYLPQLACTFAEFNALLIGLAHRALYSTGSKMLAESMVLPHRPQGHDALCQLVMSGQLGDAEMVTTVLEDAWTGIGPWAERQQLNVAAVLRNPMNVETK
ncbi:MAG TPA: kanamycin nucleotidyltransferase C-terminal domain-containing protein [Caldilineaceae bacterium]|nr:kanamycin nucleotidyltransferase C-terminal domain-containing protein [Caldilineaceae bacterium]